ncbi:GNAT family N-acetyltransferase [Paenibacillus macerans]|uniref:GNAT family N-acetyltransferase n=1 Tax=Paenibacillus macerans TaxID=44252 RepID=UPI003D31AE9E
MPNYTVGKMTDYSKEIMMRLRRLEQLCKEVDGSGLRVGLDSVKPVNGDRAYLAYSGRRLAGFLSWYTMDGAEANIHAMVHPEDRRQGVFRRLLASAAAEMGEQGIGSCRFKVPANSKPGLSCIAHLGAAFNNAEYSMELVAFQDAQAGRSGGLSLRKEELTDFGFMVRCVSQAFGDTEAWTIDYFRHTMEPERQTYIALDGQERVGMIRVNRIRRDTAVIHDFCVLPLYQGKGYGREILAQMVRLLLAEEQPLIRLGVVSHNRHALELYRKLGFEIVSESNYYVCRLHDWIH